MSVRQEVVDQLNKDKLLKDLRVYNGKYIQYREQYIRNKKRGDYSIIIQEWDEFQEEREIQNKNKEEIYMSERRVLVRLSRDYQVVEVEVSNIEDRNDFAVDKDWAKSECERLLNEVTNVPNATPKKTTAKEYVEKQEGTKKPLNGVYTAEHLTTKFVVRGQIGVAVKGLNEGRYTIEQVNALSSFDEMQALLFAPRKKKY